MGRRDGTVGRWARQLRRPERLRVLVAVAGVVVLSGVATVVATAEAADIEALDDARQSVLTTTASERAPSVEPWSSTTGEPRLSGDQPGPATPTQASPTTRPLQLDMAPGPQMPSVRVYYPDFHQVSGLRLGGAATTADGRLVLAESRQQAGSAWATQRVDVNRSFGSWFKVVVNGPTDGLAFVIQADGEEALGGPGSGIGYGSPPGGDQSRTIRPSVAVELDTWHNGQDGYDPAGLTQHIAVTTDGDITRHHVWADPGFDLQTNEPFFVWVTYKALSRTMTVRVSPTVHEPTASLLSYSVDLRAHLGTDTAWLGFTGGTGLVVPGEGRAEVLSWSASQS